MHRLTNECLKKRNKQKTYVQQTIYIYKTFQLLKKPYSPVTGIISHEHWIWNDKRQLLNVHHQPLQIFLCDWSHVNIIAAAGVDPKVTGVHSFETISTEGARLRSSTPEANIWCNVNRVDYLNAANPILQELKIRLSSQTKQPKGCPKIQLGMCSTCKSIKIISTP